MPQARLAGAQARLAGPQAWLDGPEGGWTDGCRDGWTDGRTDEWKISSFYRSSSPIGAAALISAMKAKKKSRAGQGNHCPFDAFGLLI